MRTLSISTFSFIKLCDPVNQPNALESIFDIICLSLCREHIFYALDLHINALQSVDTKQDINLHIFPLIKQLNNIIYLFEQFTNTNVLAPVLATPYHMKISNKFKTICNDLEIKIDISLEK
jgi:hypothetical protein